LDVLYELFGISSEKLGPLGKCDNSEGRKH